MRVAILGNSGSGKSTLARSLAESRGAPVLDLDTVAWEPGQIAVARSPANCRSRPWESHKYASRKEQDERLAFLLSWVSEYYTREGEMSLAGHRACFDAYSGAKEELTGGNRR